MGRKKDDNKEEQGRKDGKDDNKEEEGREDGKDDWEMSVKMERKRGQM